MSLDMGRAAVPACVWGGGLVRADMSAVFDVDIGRATMRSCAW